MRRAAAGVAAAVALAAPAVAHATAVRDAALARKGITHAVARHWVKPADALRYRTAVTRALRDVKSLPRLRGDGLRHPGRPRGAAAGEPELVFPEQPAPARDRARREVPRDDA